MWMRENGPQKHAGMFSIIHHHLNKHLKSVFLPYLLVLSISDFDVPSVVQHTKFTSLKRVTPVKGYQAKKLFHVCDEAVMNCCDSQQIIITVKTVNTF